MNGTREHEEKEMGRPVIQLRYPEDAGCPDCGVREVKLPAPLPPVGDDFDWILRDYDSFRFFMLEELAARFPERTRWTPADMEVAIVEVLSTVLDWLSDMADRVASEATLDTARRPESVRRLLSFIGYDAILLAPEHAQIPHKDDGSLTDHQKIENIAQLESFWLNNPLQMERARREGPTKIRTQRRMVSLDDYSNLVQEHPLVAVAAAWDEWGGSWPVVHVATILKDELQLDEQIENLSENPDDVPIPNLPFEFGIIDTFHEQRELRDVNWRLEPTPRIILRYYIDKFRMAGQEVILDEAVRVGVSMSISIRVAENYFQSEVRHDVDQALGRGPGRFFEPGRLRFGEDLYASDLIETLMSIDGVEHVCLNRFKRLGSIYPDQVSSGVIPLDGLEVAVCNNDPKENELGYYQLTLHGGRIG